MKIGILITARLGSTRLKKKHLLDVMGKPILFYLIKRIITEFDQEIVSGKIGLVIATSDEPENREFEMFNSLGVKVFYGSKNNIPLRHLQTANYYGFDRIISVDGDDILCSVQGMRELYNSFEKNSNIYIKTSGLPFGMNSFGYSKDFLCKSLDNHSDDILETGWGRLFDEKQLVEIKMFLSTDIDCLRFTLDYEEDYHFFKAVIEAFGQRIITVNTEDIVYYVVAHKLYTINEAISQAYWNNFYSSRKKEANCNDNE